MLARCFHTEDDFTYFFTPPVEGALLRAAFEASCLRGCVVVSGVDVEGRVRMLRSDDIEILGSNVLLCLRYSCEPSV